MPDYAHPEALVDIPWALAHLHDPTVRFVEVDVDTLSYQEGHLPGAIAWSWHTQLCDTVTRDVLSTEQLEDLLGAAGISPDTTVVLYGDNNNWFAAWGFWLLKMYGHRDVRLLDGGRRKWIEEGHLVTHEVPRVDPRPYRAAPPDRRLRALLPEVRAALRGEATLVDVRTPKEFSGEILAPPGLPETCQRGGHIPGAVNIPWDATVSDDGTFKPRHELEALYAAHGVTADRPAIVYCRIGERSSHTWFVLTRLLGRDDVKNYDGSWTEWGNLVGAPIAR